MEPQSTAPSPVILDPIATQRGDALSFVNSFIDKSDSFRARYVRMWDELLANYLVAFDVDDRMTYAHNWNRGAQPLPPRDFLFKGRTSTYRGARLKDPESNQIAESLAAQALGLAFGQRDYCQAVPIGLDDPEKARLISRLVMALLEDPGVYLTNYLGFKDAFIFGTSIMELGYERCQRIQMTMQGPQMVTYKDGILLRPVDIYDWYPDPMGTRIHHDMIGAAKRFRITKAQAIKLVQYGCYDAEAVKRLVATTSSKSDQNRGRERFGSDNREVPSETGILTGFEYWGEVPYQTADGATNRVITVLGNEVVRDSMNPFFDGGIPFKEIVVNPIQGRHYGLSPLEVVRFVQDAADNLMMATNDAIDLAVNVPLLVGAAFGGNPQQLRNRAPLDLIHCANPEAVAPVPVDLSAITAGVNYLDRLKQNMREAGGATNPVQSIPSGDRTTATESSILEQYGSRRIGLMVQLYERDYLPWLGRTAISRLKQFANPMQIATLAGDQFMVNLDQINLPADVSFVGSTSATSKFQKVAAFREALTVLSNPDVVMMFPDVVMRYLRDGLDIKDAPIIVQNAVQTMAMQMLAQKVQEAASGNAQEEQAAAKGQASPPKSANTSESAGAEEAGTAQA